MNGEFMYFSDGQGSGYIEQSAGAISVKKIGFTAAGQTIAPGQITDLVGFFCRPLKYLGQKARHELIFYIGNDGGLFPLHFFQAVFWVSETRIYEQFRPSGGRDFNFVGSIWK